MSPRADAERALARIAAAAAAIAVLGDTYLIVGSASPIAFGPAGLLWPLAASVALILVPVLAWGSTGPAGVGSRRLALAVSLGYAAFGVALGLVPPVARDELTHHLALPALYWQRCRIFEVPFAEQSYYPMLLEMYYTPLWGWFSAPAPRILHLLFGLGAAATVSMVALQREGPRAVPLATTLVLFTPTVASLATTAYVDLGVLFYTAVALTTLLLWFDTNRFSWLALSALSAGAAGATKYNGLIVVALLALGSLLAPHHASLRRACSFAILYGALALLPLSPWLAKNALQTGNPLFPLFAEFAGGRPPTPRPAIDVFSRRRFLHGETWPEIAAVPVRVFLTGREGSPAQFDGVLHPLFLLGIAAALRRKASREQRLLLGFAAAYFACVFFQTDMRARYLLPTVPAAALLTTSAIVRIGRRNPGLASALLAAGALFSGAHLVDRWLRLNPLALWTGRESRAAYVARHVPEFPVVEYANRNLPENALVYLAFLGNRSYYLARSFVYDTYYSGTTLREAAEAGETADELAARLRHRGITHLLAADGLLARYLGDNLSSAGLERWNTFAARHLVPLASHAGVTLYEIR